MLRGSDSVSAFALLCLLNCWQMVYVSSMATSRYYLYQVWPMSFLLPTMACCLTSVCLPHILQFTTSSTKVHVDNSHTYLHLLKILLICAKQTNTAWNLLLMTLGSHEVIYSINYLTNRDLIFCSVTIHTHTHTAWRQAAWKTVSLCVDNPTPSMIASRMMIDR